VTSEPVKSHVGVGFVSINDAQRKSEVVAKCVQITFCLLDLGELLSAAGLGDDVDGELIGGCTTDEIGEVGDL
jgi:hypothetical protein